ncbi:MAG: SIS domain-containing protein [Clostridia bacterium]|nr:SIS domain-containing protein [Clostridia bacterium]
MAAEAADGGGAAGIEAFAGRVAALIRSAATGQAGAIARAGGLVAEAMARGGMLHTLGTGHSHLLAEELYSRAGGLLPVRVLESAPLMLHEDAVASGSWERLPGAAAVLLEHAGLRPERDVLLVISNSGRNAVPVEAAEWARARGMPVIALTSLAHSRAVPSRAPSGRRLFEVADVVLDNLGEPGDAAVEVRPGLRAAPTSTVVGAWLLQAVVLAAVEQMLERGLEPPVLRSANVPGAEEANRDLLARWRGRLPEPYERLRQSLARAEREDGNDGTRAGR